MCVCVCYWYLDGRMSMYIQVCQIARDIVFVVVVIVEAFSSDEV